ERPRRARHRAPRLGHPRPRPAAHPGRGGRLVVVASPLGPRPRAAGTAAGGLGRMARLAAGRGLRPRARAGRHALFPALHDGPGKLQPRDAAERKQAERILLTSDDPGLVRATARQFGVTYVAVDSSLVEEYGADSFEALARTPIWRTVLASARVRIVALP